MTNPIPPNKFPQLFQVFQTCMQYFHYFINPFSVTGLLLLDIDNEIQEDSVIQKLKDLRGSNAIQTVKVQLHQIYLWFLREKRLCNFVSFYFSNSTSSMITENQNPSLQCNQSKNLLLHVAMFQDKYYSNKSNELLNK